MSKYAEPLTEQQLKQLATRRKLRWVTYTAGFPATTLMILGYEWGAMSTAMATCSMVAMTLVTIGIFSAMTIVCEW